MNQKIKTTNALDASINQEIIENHKMKPGPPAAFGKHENIIIYEDFPGVLGSTEPRKKPLYGTREHA